MWKCIQESTVDPLVLQNSRRDLPCGRKGAATWRDASGNLWLFGGSYETENQKQITLGDLWFYNPQRNRWTHVSGADPGAKSLQDDSTPAPRSFASSWTDAADTLWLFGGIPSDPVALGILGDFWKIPSSRRSWIRVPQVGARENNDSNNGNPNARWGAAAWTDSSDAFWLFAGQQSCSGFPLAEIRSDLWVYSASGDKWIFKGEGTFLASGSTLPSPRLLSSTCVIGDQLWLFGGMAPTPRGEQLADLWRFNASSEQCLKADVRIDEPLPRARLGAAMFADIAGNIYVFGGYAHDVRNDLWMFDVSRQLWTWKDGLLNERFSSIGEFRDAASHHSIEYPSPRSSASTWTNEDGHFWLFGGNGLHGKDVCMLNDLWTYQL